MSFTGLTEKCQRGWSLHFFGRSHWNNHPQSSVCWELAVFEVSAYSVIYEWGVCDTTELDELHLWGLPSHVHEITWNNTKINTFIFKYLILMPWVLVQQCSFLNGQCGSSQQGGITDRRQAAEADLHASHLLLPVQSRYSRYSDINWQVYWKDSHGGLEVTDAKCLISDPGCHSNLIRKHEWLQRNLGIFCKYATLSQLQTLDSHFTEVSWVLKVMIYNGYDANKLQLMTCVFCSLIR